MATIGKRLTDEQYALWQQALKVKGLTTKQAMEQLVSMWVASAGIQWIPTRVHGREAYQSTAASAAPTDGVGPSNKALAMIWKQASYAYEHRKDKPFTFRRGNKANSPHVRGFVDVMPRYQLESYPPVDVAGFTFYEGIDAGTGIGQYVKLGNMERLERDGNVSYRLIADSGQDEVFDYVIFQLANTVHE